MSLLQDHSYPDVSGQDIAVVPLSSFSDHEGDEPISVVANSWVLSNNFPGENVIWDERQGILYVSDFDSTDADDETVYTIDLTISDSAGMTREISFSFLVLSAEESPETAGSTNTTVGSDTTIEECNEEEDEDCESEYYEIDCPECDEDSETSTSASSNSTAQTDGRP